MQAQVLSRFRQATHQPPYNPRMPLLRIIPVHLLAFIGGFVIMSLELLGGRALAPWFGASVYVWGSVIAVFMLALSLGYLLGGRLSQRRPSLGKLGVAFLAGAALLYPARPCRGTGDGLDLRAH